MVAERVATCTSRTLGGMLAVRRGIDCPEICHVDEENAEAP